MQFLGPDPKGMYVYGSILSLFSLLNLRTHTHTHAEWMKKRNKAITCKDRFGYSKSLLYLSGLNSSGLGHTLGSRCRGHVGTMTTMSFGITRPLISMFALATRSRRAAMGYNRRDSLMTLSRYSICIRAWYSTGAFTDTHTRRKWVLWIITNMPQEKTGIQFLMRQNQ